MKFNLRIKSSQPSSGSSSHGNKCHLSSWHEREKVKTRKEKEKQLKQAVEYCVKNNCKGHSAISSALFPLIKNPRTINRRLGTDEGKKQIMTGREKDYCKILTDKEEASLVNYMLNRNRCRQAISEAEAEGVVLNILRSRQAVNRKGGRKFCVLSSNAKKCLETKRVGRSFFRRLRGNYPQLKTKMKNKVSLKRGLRCTWGMAIEHLDELADLLIQTGIAPDLKKIKPGVWRGKIDTTHIWAHDEMPQFINYKQSGFSRKKVFAGSGEDCTELSKDNRECVTIQPFTNFKGDQALCQVIFSGYGHNSHMCPESAAENIPNLMISVNESGYSDHNTLHSAYKELGRVINSKDLEKPNVIIADGHKSRFGPDVIRYYEDSRLDQYLIPPDTSGVTQLHDQVNNMLHQRYEEKEDEIFSGCSDINKEGFMTILAEIWQEWVTPEQLVKAGKRVGITEDGLDVK